MRSRWEWKRPVPEIPLVSVVTVVFNGEEHLEKTIKSVLEQDYGNIEYIVVDGGSTDGTLDILKKYDDRIAYWVSEKDEGIADAFNKGISLSSGEIVGMINSDDCYLPGAIRKITEVFDQFGTDIIVHGNIIAEELDRRRRIRPRPLPQLWKYVDFPYNHPAMFVPRKIYDVVGNYKKDYRYSMDYDFCLRAMRFGVPFRYLDDDLASFSCGGVSSQTPINCHKEVLRSQKENGLALPVCYSTFCLKVAVNKLKAAFRNIHLRSHR